MFCKSKVNMATTQELVDGLFTATNYDGALAAESWRKMNNKEQKF